MLIGIIALILSSIYFNGNLVYPIWVFCWIQYVGYFIIGNSIYSLLKKKKKSVVIIGSIIAMVTLVIMILEAISNTKK